MIDFDTLSKIAYESEKSGKLIVAKGFKKLPKMQKIAQSGHTAWDHLMDEAHRRKCVLKSLIVLTEKHNTQSNWPDFSLFYSVGPRSALDRLKKYSRNFNGIKKILFSVKSCEATYWHTEEKIKKQGIF